MKIAKLSVESLPRKSRWNAHSRAMQQSRALHAKPIDARQSTICNLLSMTHNPAIGDPDSYRASKANSMSSEKRN